MLLAGCAQQTLDRTHSAAKGRYAIDGAIFGKQIVIATGDQFAGAIDSVIWDRKEFINRDDHGRQLQSASIF
ncbi:MAG: hypothetical protein H7326_06890 [Bdellovibrionaceae bacterium]|nr:hypothetical protein [Pseudobdellovibrionaceae bacterium]